MASLRHAWIVGGELNAAQWREAIAPALEAGAASMAAGIALITAAGGKVTGWRGDTIDLCLTSDVIASNGQLHDRMLDYLG
ncbi:MAG TPA: hypothetical protein VEK57_17385 [Thermoanaerobaculia bacterium]|nr:hypothetical protein [Thermoanaerobaculia bacterium]